MRKYEDVSKTVNLLVDIARLLEDLEEKVERLEKEVIRGGRGREASGKS